MAYLDQRRWEAVAGRDATHDGEFVFAVMSTGVYCRPSCPAKRPRRENVEFFRQPDEAVHKAQAARARVLERLTWQHTARRVKERLEAVTGSGPVEQAALPAQQKPQAGSLCYGPVGAGGYSPSTWKLPPSASPSMRYSSRPPSQRSRPLTLLAGMF